MKRILHEKLGEALRSVLPLCAAVLLFDALLRVFFGKGMPAKELVRFAIGALFVLAGILLLALGEDLAMVDMGDRIGAHITRSGKYPLLIVSTFLLGSLVAFAEPNLAIFASQVDGIADRTVVVACALGLGVFMVLSLMRVIRRIPLSVALTLVYAAAFGLAFAAPRSVPAAAFDAGGIATGPVTASFIMAVGLGLASVRGGSRSVDDSFGTVALCTAGPVIALLLLGIFSRTGDAASAHADVSAAQGTGIVADYLSRVPVFIEEVALALLPIVLFFALYQFLFLRLRGASLLRLGVGLVYTFVGHVLFLTGAFAGFLPTGRFLGQTVAAPDGNLRLLLIPMGMLMGALAVIAEPGLHALEEQVERVTVGAVKKRAMRVMLALGGAAAAGIAMLRVLTGVPLWAILLGAYAASLALSFVVPRVFTAIAFDSGSVAVGAMTVTLLMPFANAAGSTLADPSGTAFGLAALIAVMPILTVQTLGLIYKIKLSRTSYLLRTGDARVTILSFDEEEAA